MNFSSTCKITCISFRKITSRLFFDTFLRTFTACDVSVSTLLPLTESPNKDFVVNPMFVNRNPRNLEQMAIAMKQQGWALQSPPRDYYHKVILERSLRNTTGRVEHFTGKTVILASTVEWSIKEQLYSPVDISAARNIGRILAQRCLECGICNVVHIPEKDDISSGRLQVFLESLQEVGLQLQEPEVIKKPYVPGIDYSRPHRIGERKAWKDDYQPL